MEVEALNFAKLRSFSHIQKYIVKCIETCYGCDQHHSENRIVILHKKLDLHVVAHRMIYTICSTHLHHIGLTKLS